MGSLVAHFRPIFEASDEVFLSTNIMEALDDLTSEDEGGQPLTGETFDFVHDIMVAIYNRLCPINDDARREKLEKEFKDYSEVIGWFLTGWFGFEDTSIYIRTHYGSGHLIESSPAYYLRAENQIEKAEPFDFPGYNLSVTTWSGPGYNVSPGASAPLRGINNSCPCELATFEMTECIC